MLHASNAWESPDTGHVYTFVPHKVPWMDNMLDPTLVKSESTN